MNMSNKHFEKLLSCIMENIEIKPDLILSYSGFIENYPIISNVERYLNLIRMLFLCVMHNFD